MIALLLALLAYTPYPPSDPTTTVPGAVNECEIESISAVFDDDDPDVVVGTNVILRCNETSTVTDLYTLFLDDGPTTEMLNLFIDQIDGVDAPDDVFEVH